MKLLITFLFCGIAAGQPVQFGPPTNPAQSNYILSIDGYALTDPCTNNTVKQGESITFTVRQTPISGYSGTTNLIAAAHFPFSLSPTSITGAGTATITFYPEGTDPGQRLVSVFENVADTPFGANFCINVVPATSPSVDVTALIPFQPFHTLAPDILYEIRVIPLIEQYWLIGNQAPYVPIETRGTSTAQFTVTASPLAGYAPGPLSFSTGTLDAGISVSFASTVTVGGIGMSTSQAAAPLTTQAQQYLAGSLSCDAYTSAAGSGALTCDQVKALGTFQSASILATVSSSSSAALGNHAVPFTTTMGGSTFTARAANLHVD